MRLPERIKAWLAPLATSTKVGIALVLGLFCMGVMLPWLPSPSGWIFFVLVIYVALPMLLLTATDLSKLWQRRLVLHNVSLVRKPFAPDRAFLDLASVSSNYLMRWRRWRSWLLLATLAALAWLLTMGWHPSLIIPVALLVSALVRDFFLAVNILQSAPARLWLSLPRYENLWLRAYAFLCAVVLTAAALTLVAVIWYLLFVEPFRWNAIAFSLCWGIFGINGMLLARRWFTVAFHTPDPDTEPASIEVWRERIADDEKLM